MCAYSVLHFALLFNLMIPHVVFAVMTYADYRMVGPWLTYQTFRLFFPITNNAEMIYVIWDSFSVSFWPSLQIPRNDTVSSEYLPPQF